MFNKVLIANRGEIACRIIKTCRRLGIQTLAVYSDADKDSLFVKQADEACCIGPAPSKDSYLNIDKIIDVAIAHQVDAIHPGYGFLSENVGFAKRLSDVNIVFIGPNIDAIELMGSKSNAKTAMEKAKVPVTPGYHGDNQDEATLLKAAQQIGFPVLLKAAAGGGGKGMRVVNTESDFSEALTSAKREAQKSFGDDKMLIETYLASPRHIEVQVFADTKGNVVHLFERDCSIQRRHQKIIEEAPATHIPDTIKAKLFEAAIKAARAVNYVGAGTIEFLYSDNDFYFMEMNTRLQVEHPVTEMITGLDLVEWQLRVANQEALPLKQEDIKSQGHAIEVRLYAEDTDNQFLPQTGIVEECQWPTQNATTRIDTGIEKKSEIGIHYDPMIAKIITYGHDRTEAIETMQEALKSTVLTGITHNRLFLMQILAANSFHASPITTHYLKQHPVTRPSHPPLDTLATALFPLLETSHNPTPWENLSAFQINLPRTVKRNYQIAENDVHVLITRLEKQHFEVTVNQQTYQVHAERKAQQLNLTIDGKRYVCQVYQTKDRTDIVTDYTEGRIKHPRHSYALSDTPKGQLTAPMPGNIVAILCKEKEKVDKGQTLMVIEAMKMEHSIHAPTAAVIKDIFFKEGAQVNEGDELLALENPA